MRTLLWVSAAVIVLAGASFWWAEIGSAHLLDKLPADAVRVRIVRIGGGDESILTDPGEIRDLFIDPVNEADPIFSPLSVAGFGPAHVHASDGSQQSVGLGLPLGLISRRGHFLQADLSRLTRKYPDFFGERKPADPRRPTAGSKG